MNRLQLKNTALVFMVLDNVWLRFSASFSSAAHLVTRFVAPLLRFFYAFYPIHLCVLVILSAVI